MARGRIQSSGMGATFWLSSVATPSQRAEGQAARAIQRRRSGSGGGVAGAESGSAAVSIAERGTLRKAAKMRRATTAA